MRGEKGKIGAVGLDEEEEEAVVVVVGEGGLWALIFCVYCKGNYVSTYSALEAQKE